MGVKLEVWKQGQFYPDLGKKIIELPYSVNPGPSDAQVSIVGFNVQPDPDGNFLNGNYSEDDIDAINTYGTVRQVIDFYEKLLGETIKWSWQKKGVNKPLKVKIRNNDINSRFLKKQRCIELDYYGTETNRTYNCRTVDIIAHETGHAILDCIKPHLNTGNAETRGLGEAFCDLLAMFLVLSQKDLCEHTMKETGGDLRRNSILTLFSLGHGFDVKGKKEIRSAINNFKYNVKEKFPYPYGQVIVGLLYDLLYTMFEEKEANNDVEAIYTVGKIWMKGITEAFIKLNEDEFRLNSFINNIIKTFNSETNTILKHLKIRQIF